MTLLSELRRRKVFRIAVIYSVAAWGVLQAADVLGALAGLPDWSLRIVLMVLALGFPISLFLAWVFKLTPRGIRRDQAPSPATPLLPGRPGPPNARALSVVLKGRHALDRWTAAGCHEALAHFEEALAADPTLADAQVGIAKAFWWLASYGSLLPAQGFPKARAAAERALALDGRLADAHLALGQVKFGYDWDFRGAEASFRRALELEPDNAEAHDLLGHFLQMMARQDEAIEQRREAVRLDPLSLPMHLGLADSLFTAGRLREAVRELEVLAELDPGYPIQHLQARIDLASGRPRDALETIRQDPMGWRRHYISAIAYHRLRRPGQARAELHELIASHGDDAALQIAIVHAQTGDRSEALRWLERALEQRDPGLIELESDPEFEPLRSDERFRRLAQRVGFRPEETGDV